MFRKPREAIPSLADIAPQAPSTGRPPTPPDPSQRPPSRPAINYKPPMAIPTTPLLGRSKLTAKPTPRAASSASKAKPTGNGNILNFFQKSATPKSDAVIRAEESLFLDDDDFGTAPGMGGGFGKVLQTPMPPREERGDGVVVGVDEEEEVSRFNEADGSVKRRKMEERPKRSTSSPGGDAGARKKPFFARTESLEDTNKQRLGDSRAATEIPRDTPIFTPEAIPAPDRATFKEGEDISHPIPSLKQESTSYGEINDFDGIEDFIDDEFPEEGEEYLERRWMQEQADLELGLEEDEEDEGGVAVDDKTIKEESKVDTKIVMHNEEANSCPICSASLVGITDQVGFNAGHRAFPTNGI